MDKGDIILKSIEIAKRNSHERFSLASIIPIPTTNLTNEQCSMDGKVTAEFGAVVTLLGLIDDIDENHYEELITTLLKNKIGTGFGIPHMRLVGGLLARVDQHSAIKENVIFNLLREFTYKDISTFCRGVDKEVTEIIEAIEEMLGIEKSSKSRLVRKGQVISNDLDNIKGLEEFSRIRKEFSLIESMSYYLAVDEVGAY